MDIMCVCGSMYSHNITEVATVLTEWCTFWCRQPRACVWTFDTSTRGILCFLDCMLVKVQAPRLTAHQRLDLRSSLCGCCSSNLSQLITRIAGVTSQLCWLCFYNGGKWGLYGILRLIRSANYVLTMSLDNLWEVNYWLTGACNFSVIGPSPPFLTGRAAEFG